MVHHVPANKRALVLWTSVMLVTLLIFSTTKFKTLVLLTTEMNLLDLRSNVKGEGHVEIRYGKKSTFGAILSPW